MEETLSALRDMQRVDPSPAVLRQYSSTSKVRRMGENGENFAALVQAIRDSEDGGARYLGWLRQLSSAEAQEIVILQGALGEPMFALKQRGRAFAAPLLSDGTLRFAAVAAAFFQPDRPTVLMIEELENSIHPSRLRLLMELLRAQAAEGGIQVFATTYSPIVLAWLKEEEYQSTFFCRRDEATGASIITPLTDVPGFIEIVRRQPISDLFSEGWLECAL